MEGVNAITQEMLKTISGNLIKRAKICRYKLGGCFHNFLKEIFIFKYFDFFGFQSK